MSADDATDKPNLLLVDDDETFCRGFTVNIAHTVGEGLNTAEKESPEFAVVDLKMPGPSGLELVKKLKEHDPHTKIVVLTGYASVATAVEAIKLGATHYLTKPADADEIVAAFERVSGDAAAPVAAKPLPLPRVEWEHIQKVLAECDGNMRW